MWIASSKQAAGAGEVRRRRPCVDPSRTSRRSITARRKIYPQSVHGTFRRIKWAVLIVTLGIYYFLPFVRWDRGPDAPDQAVLIDFPGRRFYFFFIEIWPQEVYYFTGLLILAAMALFLMNARRRPRLVRLSLPADGLDRSVPRDRALRRGRPARADHRRRPGPWTAQRVARKAAKHSSG